MPAPLSKFRTNCPPIVEETLDGESIVVNLDTGTYYALVGVASYVWEALGCGCTLDELTELVAGGYAVDPGEAGHHLRALLDELVDEQLVVAGDGPVGPPASPPARNGRPLPYAVPVLTKYTDMQELLLLDPVHEVDDAGWPSRA